MNFEKTKPRQQLPIEHTDTIDLVAAKTESRPLPFRELGDYELLELIGQGGMGIIFKARQRSLGRLAAVKLILAGAAAKAGEIARFRTEAAAAARLQHPGIVSIYEVGEHLGQPFYSMEFVPGRSLAAAVRGGPWAPAPAAKLLKTVAQAVHFAHEQGILHRDLKPSNILLDSQDEPRVADFGLAKILADDSDLTLSGAVLGSPQYLPPEQAAGCRADIGVRSDVYSLGAILYELLTGWPPFRAATPLDTLRLVLEQEPPPPRANNQTLPRDLETICLKCLAKQPAGRYSSAQALAEDLGRFLNREPISARPVTWMERSWRWCRRKPALAGLGAVLAIAPALIIGVLLSASGQVRRERNSTQLDLYAADVALAGRALGEENYDLASRSLKPHRPARSFAKLPSGLAENDPRGFEWRWLWRQAQGDPCETIFGAHHGPVTAISYSPDGRLLASTSSKDGLAKVWEVSSQRCLFSFEEPGHSAASGTDSDPKHPFQQAYESPLGSVSFSPDGLTLLTGCRSSLRLWALTTGRLVRILGSNTFFLAMFAPTDANLALATRRYSYAPGLPSLCLLEVNQGRTLLEFTNGRADAVCFTPDGRQFARWDRGGIGEPWRLWLHKFPSGEVINSFATEGTYIEQMVIAQEGSLLAACNLHRGAIDLFELPSGRRLSPLIGHTARGHALALSPDGRWLASGGYDQSIRLWDLESHRELRRWHGHRGPILSLAFSPDGRQLASGGSDGTIRFWDVRAEAPKFSFGNVLPVFAFSNDGRWLVTQRSNELAQLWELPALQSSPSNQNAAGSPFRLALEWRAPPFQSAIFTAAGELATASTGSANESASVRFFPDVAAQMIKGAKASSELALRKSGSSATLLTNISSSCSAIALSPDGHFAVTGHRDGTVALWEIDSGRFRQKLACKEEPAVFGEVNTIVFSADSRTVVAISSQSGRLRSWTLPVGRLVASRFLGRETICALSPDGSQVLTAGVQQGFNVNLWDAAMRSPATQLRGHKDNLDALACSPDGRTLATAGEDGVLKLWHLPTRREVAKLLVLGQGDFFRRTVAFSPDGAWLAACDNTGTLHLFYAPLAEFDSVAAERKLRE